jgi:hypothetical protein
LGRLDTEGFGGRAWGLAGAYTGRLSYFKLNLEKPEKI